jgi:hypothetical protein
MAKTLLGNTEIFPKGVTAASLDAAVRTAYAEDTQNWQDTASAIANRFNDKRYSPNLMKIVGGKNMFEGYQPGVKNSNYMKLDAKSQTYSDIRATLKGMLDGSIRPTHGYTDFIAGTGDEAGRNVYSNPIQSRQMTVDTPAETIPASQNPAPQPGNSLLTGMSSAAMR